MKLDLEKLLSDVASEKGISRFHVETIYRSVFEMVAETMREGNADNILIPRFGKFIVPRKKLAMKDLQKYKEKYGTE
jgi:nucleoid DNA-binding protein